MMKLFYVILVPFIVLAETAVLAEASSPFGQAPFGMMIYQQPGAENCIHQGADVCKNGVADHIRDIVVLGRTVWIIPESGNSLVPVRFFRMKSVEAFAERLRAGSSVDVSSCKRFKRAVYIDEGDRLGQWSDPTGENNVYRLQFDCHRGLTPRLVELVGNQSYIIRDLVKFPLIQVVNVKDDGSDEYPY